MTLIAAPTRAFPRAALLAVLVLAGCDDAGTSATARPDAGRLDAARTPPDAVSPDATPPDAAPPDAAPPDAGFVPETPEQEALYSVPETARRVIPGLEAPVHVVRTEADVPHIFAANRRDLARVHGFLFAKDRFWMMDLARRLALGRLSALVGDVLLNTDITSRAKGLPLTARRLTDALSPERRAELEAFAEGINVYVDAVAAGDLPPPSEIKLAAPLLGARDPAELVEPFTLLDVMAFAAVVMEQSTCATGELQRTAALLDTYGAYPPDAPFAELRERGLRDDIFYRIEPLVPVFTVGGRREKSGVPRPPRELSPARAPLELPRAMLSRTAHRLARWREMGTKALGSNAWAVSGAHTTDGATLLAGDGHLALTVPTYFHQAGLDTGVLGGELWHARGNFIAGLPALGVGTNGYVAWSFTCFYSDTVDYFREEVRLGDDGLPDATRFQGAWRPVARTDETYSTRAVPILRSPGGDVTEPRFETFDGRRILSIEGRAPEEGEAGVNVGDGPIVPGDEDGDGVITAISTDATYLDVGDAIGGYIRLAETKNIEEFRDAQRRLAVFGSHFVAADREGHILATGYHASPCRTDLPRTEDGHRFAPGANPQVVLDGTRFGGFTLRYAADGTVDESGDDPASCVVPFDQFPYAEDPESGYLVSANNDPSGLALDGSLADDGIYIGGPWNIGLRAGRIDERVAAAAAAGTADVETMARVQGDTRSSSGALWAPVLVQSIVGGRALAAAGAPLDGADARVARIYQENAARFDAVEDRITAWIEADYPTPSGVKTFYHTPAAGEADLAVATMIFNAWSAHFEQWVLGDEPITPGDRMTDLGSVGRALENFLAGRGPDNPRDLASWSPETQETVLFDVLGTDEVERSDEVALLALESALDFLESEPEEDAEGGFGTADMDAWLWGLRHTVRFESILAPFVGDISGFNLLVERFGITTDVLPLMPGGLPRDDPRRALVGFPRPGDNYSVDSADPGFRPTRFEYAEGPVKRLVIALHPDGRVTGQNIIPGGQSGLTDSPHFADQAALWLANETLPLRFQLDEIVAGAVGREVYLP